MRSKLVFPLILLLASSLTAQKLSDEEKAKVEKSIENAVSAANAAVKAASNSLMEVIDAAIRKQRDGSTEIAALVKQRAAFKDKQVLPTHRLLVRGSKVYVKAVEKAERTRNKALDDSIKGLRGKDVEFWLEAQKKIRALKKEKLNKSIDPALSAWTEGSRWVDQKKTIWTVRSFDGETLVLRRPTTKQKRGSLVFEVEVSGKTLRLKNFFYEKTPIKMLTRKVSGKGTIEAKKLRLLVVSEIKNTRSKKGWHDFNPEFVLTPAPQKN